MTVRVGVVGTGVWATRVHLPAVAAAEGFDLECVWGRDRETTRTLAANFGTAPASSHIGLLKRCDMVTYAVPPGAQCELALQAVRRGLPVMLEKPLSLTSVAARAVADEIRANRLPHVIFLSRLFDPAYFRWLAEASRHRWPVARAWWTSPHFRATSPYAGRWRLETDALDDVAPHILAALEMVLGPVVGVSHAVSGNRGRFEASLSHAAASSHVSIDLLATVAQTVERYRLSDGATCREREVSVSDWIGPFQCALKELARQVTDGFDPTLPWGVDAGVRTVETIERVRAACLTGAAADES